MQTLEAIAAIVTGVLALIGLWVVLIVTKIEMKRRKRERSER